jgi:colanic acid biosynthesis glycosyl transferase WcaI
MGGGATRAYNGVKGLLLSGCKVTVITAFPHYPAGNIPREYKGRLLKVEYQGELKVIRTYVPPLASKGIVRRFVLFMSFIFSSLLGFPFIGKIDVVWAANPNVFAVFPALFYGFFKRSPVVQNIDDLWPEEVFDLGMLRSPLFRWFGELLAKIAYLFSTALTPISPAYIDTIVNKYKINPEKIYTVPAGVDLEKFSMRDQKYGRDRRREFKVLYIGAFSLAYDFHQVLRAAKLLGSYQDIKFVLQGEGELASSLKFKAREMHLENVQIIDEVVSREEVAGILGEADVLLLPLSGLGSVEMGISSKLYEYQAAGKPIVCCSSGKPGQYVSQTGSGIVVKPGDDEALAKAILCLYNNPDIAETLGKAGRQYVEDNLSCEKIGLEMRKVFEYAVNAD